ncbi:hypothetical protein [Myxococcus landrumensis]|uniref:Outer membrane protein beta-barrel domain-containing protein n=1 Tax=Myxococcus landrumensis TaxID=2813577 RepID=A0ABX7N3T0_9BACT|nr:hypothetical protein [Myxococcus landrumus]QSQ11063.1 hypothetical protein JY572_21825 [Myxococcus landrumus]
MRLTSFLVLLLLPTSAAFAEDKPGRHTHDGFYLRGQFGLGYLHSKATDVDLVVKGGAGSLNLEMGYAVLNNFILYGKLFGASASNPDIRVGGTTHEGDPDDDVSVIYAAMGVGAAYYIMPANVYFSGAVVANQLSASHEGTLEGESEAGVGLHLGVGKEWWVSGNWGIGVGAELALGRIRTGDRSRDNWDVTHVSLVFSATYN